MRKGYVTHNVVANGLLGYESPRHGSMTLQPDGKIVLAGGTSGGGADGWILTRYLANGSIDGSFGSGGVVNASFPGMSSLRIWSVAMQGSDLVACGRAFVPATGYDFVVARHLGTNGSLDASFGVNGVASSALPGEDQGFALVVDGQNQIVVAGTQSVSVQTDWMLFRFTASGSPDVAFGSGGASSLVGDPLLPDLPYSLALDPSNRLVAAGLMASASFGQFGVARWFD